MIKKSSAFAAIAATTVAVLALSATAFADPQPLAQLVHRHDASNAEANAHYLTYTGSTEQASGSGVGYLTYMGSTEQAPANGVRYLTYGGNTEQSARVARTARVVSASSRNGFGWGEFGIGAAAATAAAIAAMLAVGLVRRGRRTPTLEGVRGPA